MIMCHNNFEQLKILLSLLDYKDNDIYIHIDKKAKISETEKEEIKLSVAKSNIAFIKSQKASWGGDSLMKIEIKLLQEAVKTHHKYYHLISGADLPLKSQAEIHNFLNSNDNDYIALGSMHEQNIKKTFLYRVRYFYFFQNIIGGSSDNLFKELLLFLREKLLVLQKKIGIDRTKHAGFEYVKGSQWFTITHETAQYILKRYPLYKKYFKYSLCPDEMFVQTIIKNSDLCDNVVDNNMRCITWKEGSNSPNIYTMKDYDKIINSNKLFARKFDMAVDKEIVFKIRYEIKR